MTETRPFLPHLIALGSAFEALAPGSTMIYYTGESLAREACDWESGLKKARRKHYPPERDIRDWARRLSNMGGGFLTQKVLRKEGAPDLYDYRITKATSKENTR